MSNNNGDFKENLTKTENILLERDGMFYGYIKRPPKYTSPFSKDNIFLSRRGSFIRS